MPDSQCAVAAIRRAARRLLPEYYVLAASAPPYYRRQTALAVGRVWIRLIERAALALLTIVNNLAPLENSTEAIFSLSWCVLWRDIAPTYPWKSLSRKNICILWTKKFLSLSYLKGVTISADYVVIILN